MRHLAIACVLLPVCALAQGAGMGGQTDYVAARKALDKCLAPIAKTAARRMREGPFYNHMMTACPRQAQHLHQVLLHWTIENGPKLTAERYDEVAANGVRAVRLIHFDRYKGRQRQAKSREPAPG
jgi:hypothetical protein